MKVTHSIVLVDQAMAKRWLAENNGHNRDISDARVAQYVADMESGRWRFNGETIQFDRTGMLLNGQHRLMAILETGIPQSFLVVRGLDPQSQLTMDQGTRRSPADQLAIANVTADATIAASVRVLIRWGKGMFFGDQKVRTSTTEVVAWAQANLGAIELMHDLTEAGVRLVPCKPSIALAVAYRLSQISEMDALRFFSALRTGADLANGNPILALRNRLIGDKDKNVSNSERDVVGFLVIAWNAARAGRSLAKIQRPKGGVWTKENFPEPK